jgi:hypothetical protein
MTYHVVVGTNDRTGSLVTLLISEEELAEAGNRYKKLEI